MGTKYKGSGREVRALNAFIKLVRASESAVAGAGEVFSSAGLTVSQFGALDALLHLGPLHQCELGEKMLKSGGNITMIVDNLEKQGLVRRSQDRKDRRFNTVRLTGKGRSLIKGLFPDVAGRITGIMDSLGAKDQIELGRLCKKLGLGMKKTNIEKGRLK